VEELAELRLRYARLSLPSLQEAYTEALERCKLTSSQAVFPPWSSQRGLAAGSWKDVLDWIHGLPHAPLLIVISRLADCRPVLLNRNARHSFRASSQRTWNCSINGLVPGKRSRIFKKTTMMLSPAVAVGAMEEHRSEDQEQATISKENIGSLIRM
jgi:hypothetical protein